MPHYQTQWDNFATPLGMVCLILLVDWDPIGVFGNIGAMDEYDSYAPGVLKLLKNDADAETIVQHLHHLETDNMGLSSKDHSRLSEIAKKLQEVFRIANARTSI